MNFRIILAIAKHELSEHLGSLRFLSIFVLVLLLTPLSVFVGSRDYQGRLADYNWLVGQRQQLIDGPPGKEVRGVDFRWTSENELAVLRVIRRPQVLSILAHGMDSSMPRFWDFSVIGIESGPPAATDTSLADTFPRLDFEFLVRVVFGLLAVLIGYDAVVGEKESGTLRAALSHPVSPSSFLAGKLFGGATVLLLGFALALGAVLVSGWWIEPELLPAENWGRILWMAGVWTVYLLSIYCLALLISSLSATRKVALLGAMISWFVFSLALPPLGALLARVASPAPESLNVMEQKIRVNRALEEEAALAMGGVFREVTGAKPGDTSGEVFHQHRYEMLRRVQPILDDLVRRRQAAIEEIEAARREAIQSQRRTARAVMMLSPAAVAASIGADLAGTGDTSYTAWIERLEAHKNRLDQALFDNPPQFTLTNVRASFTTLRRSPPSVEDLPAFPSIDNDWKAVLSRNSVGIALLLFYLLSFIVIGQIAFARYDIR